MVLSQGGPLSTVNLFFGQSVPMKVSETNVFPLRPLWWSLSRHRPLPQRWLDTDERRDFRCSPCSTTTLGLPVLACSSGRRFSTLETKNTEPRLCRSPPTSSVESEGRYGTTKGARLMSSTIVTGGDRPKPLRSWPTFEELPLSECEMSLVY